MAEEIRDGDLVVVVLKVEEEKEERNKFEWGFVKVKLADNIEKKFLIETNNGDSWYSRDQLHIYASTVAISLEEALEDAEFYHPRIMLQIIAEKFQLEQQVKGLQKQINELESKIDSVNMGLMTTQEELRTHLLGPH